MAHDKPIRISCENCPGGDACNGCLVHFFLSERDAQIVQLKPEPAPPAGAPATRLEPALERVLATLRAAGLEPDLLAVHPTRDARAS
jgi:hypothetical protein